MNEPSLNKIVQLLVKALSPERITLFGSWARGDQGPESDFDLFVEVPTGGDVGKAAKEGYASLRPIRHEVRRGVDLVVKDSAFVRRYGDLAGTVVRPVLREGKVLYAR